MVEITKEVERKIIEHGVFAGLDPTPIKRRLDEIRKDKKKIKGVWARAGWMWIATEHATKMTMFGVVFSPYVGSGEYGSWYLDDPESVNAGVIVEPEYRWKVTQEEIKRHRKMIDKLL